MWVDVWHRRDARDYGSKVCCVHRTTNLTWLTRYSGSGKTTLLNVLAHRDVLTKASVDGSVYINNTQTVLRDFRRISSYVEQDDALIGSLTIRETMSFAARLSLPGSVH
jgi:ABC-type multidrug transport system ATPase subunit